MATQVGHGQRACVSVHGPCSSASSRCQKSRLGSSGWGMIRSGSATRSLPYRTMSRSSVRAPQCSVRTRPCSRSMAWQASSSSRGESRVSSSDHLIEVRRLAHAAERRGLLDRRRGRPASCRGAAASAARAAARWPVAVAQVAAEGHVRALGPRPRHRSALHGKVSGDALQVGGHVAQLADGALEVGLPGRGLGGALRQGLGLAQRAGRAGGDTRGSGRSARRPPGAARPRSTAMARAWRPASPVVPTIASSAERGVGAQLLDARARRPDRAPSAPRRPQT